MGASLEVVRADVAGEVVATIKDAERVAEREARKALADARESVKRAAAVLRPVALSPLFGNGVHQGMTEAVKVANNLDDALANLERAVHEYFHGGDE